MPASNAEPIKVFPVIDLFAGPGGLSEGFANAGFEVAAQVEKDPVACQTLRLRVVYRELAKRGNLADYWRLIRNEIPLGDCLAAYPEITERCESQVVNREFGSEELGGAEEIYSKIQNGLNFLEAGPARVLLGGPPCQAFSLVGRSRDPNRMREDKRHFLFQYFLETLDRFQPDFFVFENVPGILTAETDKGQTVRMLIEQFHARKQPYELALPPQGRLKDLILDSAWYGVPQRRKRIFFIGFRKDLKKKRPSIAGVFSRVMELASPDELTVRDAIADLPRIGPGDGSDRWWGFYEDTNGLGKYQREMRKNSEGIVNFKARTHMDRDLERYKFFIEHQETESKQATLFDLQTRKPGLMPAHKNTDKFVDRFKVQWWARPCSTVMSHISKDGHYYIHPDIQQCRSFTVREAARCQSFLDNFVFCGSRTEQFKQVGNAVPPILANAIAGVLLDELRAIDGK